MRDEALHLNFSLKFNTTNSTFFGSYAVFPKYLNSSNGSPVWNVGLCSHFGLSSLIAFNSTLDWFNYSVGEDGSLDLDNNPSTANYYVWMRANATVNTSVSYKLLVTTIGSPPGLLLVSQVGYLRFRQTMLWNRTYTWTYVNGSPVSDSDMQGINSTTNNFTVTSPYLITVSDSDMQGINSTIWSGGVENPDYAGLGPMTINASIDDLINNPDYWWITSNTYEWTWPVLNVQEVYVTSKTC